MKLEIHSMNPRHVRVNVFVAGMFNGHLCLTHEEWELFKQRFKPEEIEE